MVLEAYFCTQCGAPIQVDNQKSRVICDYCDTVFSIKKINDEQIEIIDSEIVDLKDVETLLELALKQFEMKDYAGALKSCNDILSQDETHYKAWEIKTRCCALLYTTIMKPKCESVLKFAQNALQNVPIEMHQVLANEMQNVVCDYSFMLLEKVSNTGRLRQFENEELIYNALKIYLSALHFSFVNDEILQANCERLLQKISIERAVTFKSDAFHDCIKYLERKHNRIDTYEDSVKKSLKEGLLKNELNYWLAYPNIAIENKEQYLHEAELQLKEIESLEQEIEWLDEEIAYYRKQIESSDRGFWAERLGVFEEQKIKIYQYKERLEENSKKYDSEKASAIRRKVQFLQSC